MSQKTILIIEDSVDLADSLADILTLKKYRALKALDGRQGLEMAFNEKPDLILLDLRLPDLDGIEVMQQLKADAWGQTVKILFLTASDFSEKTRPELNIKAEDIIYKAKLSAEDMCLIIENKLNQD